MRKRIRYLKLANYLVFASNSIESEFGAATREKKTSKIGNILALQIIRSARGKIACKILPLHILGERKKKKKRKLPHLVKRVPKIRFS